MGFLILKDTIAGAVATRQRLFVFQSISLLLQKGLVNLS